ncbi:MAG: DUF167 domain-containing protein [bacterium]
MKFSVKVKPGAKEERVVECGENSFFLTVKARAMEGRANKAAIELLSRNLGIAKNRITIVKGHKSRNKVIEVVS